MMRILPVLILLLPFTSTVVGQTISFSEHIRPILADRCFTCHGPDGAQRKADLRLDRQEAAADVLVPGKPEESLLLERLLSDDPDLQMPPPSSRLSVSKAEVALIRQWIKDGAHWQKHWAFVPPTRPEVPLAADNNWARDEIDHFILDRLRQENMKPNPPADPARLLRRASFDLTGLPPTTGQLDQFLNDTSPNAFQRAVDQLLQSPALGQRLALEWLDVARYGDTDGLFEDHPRSIYPWRDWLVRAFNNNISYQDMIKWQIAGDLLPEATVDQRIATGFLRNNPTSNEGGIIDEDYRIKYLVDRVNTTATSMLGLTLECAQCHDHKYDPLTQREYYQFGGFFNSLVGRGNTKGSTAPTLKNYTAEQQERLDEIDQQLAAVSKTLVSTPDGLQQDYQKWIAELSRPVDWKQPELMENKVLVAEASWWKQRESITDSAETQDAAKGRYVRVSYPKGRRGFLTISEVQVYASGNEVAGIGKATQSTVAYNSPANKAIDGNHDGRFASCSCTAEQLDPWWELDLGRVLPIQRVDVWNRTDCCPERLDEITIEVLDADRNRVAGRTIGKAQPKNSWPADAKEMPTPKKLTIDFAAPIQRITALRLESQSPAVMQLEKITMKDGETTKDLPLSRTGRVVLHGQPVLIGLKEPIDLATAAVLSVSMQAAGTDGFRIQFTDNSTVLDRIDLPDDEAKRLALYRQRWPGFDAARRTQKQLDEEKKSLEGAVAVTMVAADMSAQRENYLLIRGQYDQLGETVLTAAPSSIMPYAEDLPANRLGLARWLTDPKNPLTARVVVNRYWQMLMGQGIVKTSEDFGTQGDRPSHPELLDWLTVDFVESDWDVKRLLRKIVLSATYQQSSVTSPEQLSRDPENRLLGRVSRRRLPAESLRNHALSLSGLLSNRHGGPGVHPYQPAEIFGAGGIGSAGARFTQSRGEGLYRRSLYTYWKRQIPAANMRILGANGRNKCRTRRERTNTPLQALVMLNDPQFVEAAREMARRLLQGTEPDPRARLSRAFRMATSRRASEPELEILLAELTDRLAMFREKPDMAKQYLSIGQQPVPPGIDPSELAAYAAVCSLIMNLDESLSLS